MIKRIAVVLRDRGPEATSALNALAETGAQAKIFAPNELLRLNPEEFDALVLCHSPDEPEVEPVIREFFSAGKPMGAIGLASALIGHVLESKGVSVVSAANEICAADDYVTDRECKVVSTPGQDSIGIRKAIREVVEMA